MGKGKPFTEREEQLVALYRSMSDEDRHRLMLAAQALKANAEHKAKHPFGF